MKIKSMLEILEETVQYYSEDVSRRSVCLETDRCRYNGPDGKLCAAARMMTKEALHLKNIENYSMTCLIDTYGIEILKPEYVVLDTEFYDSIQKLHDDIVNWDENGLTVTGEAAVANIKAEYNL
jgi:hypothetical protein